MNFDTNIVNIVLYGRVSRVPLRSEPFRQDKVFLFTERLDSFVLGMNKDTWNSVPWHKYTAGNL